MKSTVYTIALVAAALAASGCVKEDLSYCDGAVVVAVRDMNYDNAAEVGDTVLAEDLPIISYITGLVSQNHPRGTNLYTPVIEGLTPVELIHSLPPERLTTGVNELTAVGNAPESAMSYGAAEASRILTLHPDGTGGEDIYLGGDAVTFPRLYDHTVWLLRTKGKLIVDVVGMPKEVANVGITVGGVYATVTENLAEVKATRASDPDAGRFSYGGTVDVSEKRAMDGDKATCHLLLAPSVAATSPFSISFTDSAETSLYTLGADIAIARNHITRIKAEYLPSEQRWTLTVNVDGKWIGIENMILY